MTVTVDKEAVRLQTMPTRRGGRTIWCRFNDSTHGVIHATDPDAAAVLSAAVYHANGPPASDRDPLLASGQLAVTLESLRLGGELTIQLWDGDKAPAGRLYCTVTATNTLVPPAVDGAHEAMEGKGAEAEAGGE